MERSINIKGTILDLNTPKVMGILNTTSDSFFDGGKYNELDQALARADQMVREGASILDIGGYSSRPGAADVSVQLELDRVVPVIEALVPRFDIPLSVDTFRSEVARASIAAGASLVNDISAGDDDPEMIPTVAELEIPYIYMHKQGHPKTMQDNPKYHDVVLDVFEYLLQKKEQCLEHGVKQLIIDPGFGFGKTVAHNYALLNNLDLFKKMDLPMLVGLSRKSMITRVLGVSAQEALNGTTFLHAFALQNGADLLRVHDVQAAMETVRLFQEIRLNP